MTNSHAFVCTKMIAQRLPLKHAVLVDTLRYDIPFRMMSSLGFGSFCGGLERGAWEFVIDCVRGRSH